MLDVQYDIPVWIASDVHSRHSLSPPTDKYVPISCDMAIVCILCHQRTRESSLYLPLACAARPETLD